MKRVLFIAYFFPPIGGSGVQRPTKFVKYLPHFDWQPYVIATQRPYADQGWDETLLADIPEDTRTWRIATPEPQPVNRLAQWIGWRSSPSLDNQPAASPATADNSPSPHLSLATRTRRAVLAPLNLVQHPPVDPALYWSLRIVPLARRIIQQERIDVILTTVPPWSGLLAGRLIQQLTGRPWVADFRDPWTDNAFIYFPTPTQRRFDERLERYLIEHADAVISVTEPGLRGLCQKASSREKNKPFVLIPNGWDQSDFPDLPVVQVGLTPDLADKQIVLLHPGSAYQGEPLPLLTAVQRLATQGARIENLRFRFVGYMHPQDQASILASAHSTFFQLDPERVSHDQALHMMRNAHVLLLLLQRDPNASSGKIFEYMVVGRPVLAIASGVAADMVQRCGIGCAVHPQDQERLTRVLRQIATDYAGFVAEYYHPNWEIINQFDRGLQAGQLAQVLNSVTRLQ